MGRRLLCRSPLMRQTELSVEALVQCLSLGLTVWVALIEAKTVPANLAEAVRRCSRMIGASSIGPFEVSSGVSPRYLEPRAGT
jgi:hypothetical protein